MLSPLSLRDFYGQTLKQAGFTPPEDQIEKFASANKLDLETTKIASAVFEQLQLDGVTYETPQDMLTDAIKIATSYVEHCKEAAAQAEKLAGDLHRVARHAVEGYLAQHGINLDADEGVKIAGMQAASFQELEQKQAMLLQQDLLANLKSAEGVTKIASFAQYGQVPGGQLADPSTLNHDASLGAVATHFGGDPAVHGPTLKSYISSQVKPEEMPGYLDKLHATAQQMPGSSFKQVHDATMASVAPKPSAPGLLQRPGVLLGAGALGLGGLYLLKKKREEAAAANNRRSAIVGAAGMPAA